MLFRPEIDTFTMASVQWWAERVDALLASTEEGCVSLWRLHADLADDAKRPDALKRADISSMRKYFEKNIVESIDLAELEKVRPLLVLFCAGDQGVLASSHCDSRSGNLATYLRHRLTNWGLPKCAKMTSRFFLRYCRR